MVNFPRDDVDAVIRTLKESCDLSRDAHGVAHVYSTGFGGSFYARKFEEELGVKCVNFPWSCISIDRLAKYSVSSIYALWPAELTKMDDSAHLALCPTQGQSRAILPAAGRRRKRNRPNKGGRTSDRAGTSRRASEPNPHLIHMMFRLCTNQWHTASGQLQASFGLGYSMCFCFFFTKHGMFHMLLFDTRCFMCFYFLLNIGCSMCFCFLLDMGCSMCFCLHRMFHVLFLFHMGCCFLLNTGCSMCFCFFAEHRMFQYCRVEVQTKSRRICSLVCLLLKVIYIFAAGNYSCQGISH